MTEVVNINSKAIYNLLNIIDVYNELHNRTNENLYIKKNYDKNIISANEIINNNDAYEAYSLYKMIELNIFNNLIEDIMNNTNKVDIFKVKFKNLKTDLFPYQINNINWMLNIENDKNNKYNFKGGGLFDEVGMGKTLQTITLIDTNKSKYNSLIKNNKLYCKATIIIVPNHLCGQWVREINNHLVRPLNVIQLLTKKHYNKYTHYDFVKADVIIVSANFFFNCKILSLQIQKKIKQNLK